VDVSGLLGVEHGRKIVVTIILVRSDSEAVFVISHMKLSKESSVSKYNKEPSTSSSHSHRLHPYD